MQASQPPARGATPTPPAVADWGLLKRLWGFAGPERAWICAAAIGVPLMSLLGLAQPWLVKHAIDEDILKHDIAGLAQTSALFLAAVLGEFVLRGGQLYALQVAGFRILARMRRRTFAHVIGQGAAFFDRQPTGALLTRTTNDIETLGEVLTFNIIGILGDLVDMVAIVAAMLLLDIKLTAMSFLVAPLIVVVVNFVRRKLRRYAVEIRVALSRLNAYFQESLSGLRVVQLEGRNDKTIEEFRTLNYAYLDAFRRSNWYDAALYAVMDGVAALCVALLIWYGGARTLEGAVSLGLLVAFIEYINRLFIPIREFSGKLATLERGMGSIERIFGLLDQDQRIADGDWEPPSPADIRGELRLDGVSFSYREDGPIALEDISLHIAPGEVLAIVGQTGSGKSTLGKLLTRGYDGVRGRITLDGVPLASWRLAALRRAIGVVQQDVFVFGGTLADNVSLGCEDIGMERVEKALERAQLSALLARLDGGAQATLAERGANLSAGERQLLSMARAFALNPRVVLLDEATASMDSLTEMAVQRAMDELFVGRTVIVIAHRLSTVRRADRIAVLERGRIVELGSHDELVAHGGHYAKLVQSRLLADGALAQCKTRDASLAPVDVTLGG